LKGEALKGRISGGRKKALIGEHGRGKAMARENLVGNAYFSKNRSLDISHEERKTGGILR